MFRTEGKGILLHIQITSRNANPYIVSLRVCLGYSLSRKSFLLPTLLCTQCSIEPSLTITPIIFTRALSLRHWNYSLHICHENMSCNYQIIWNEIKSIIPLKLKIWFNENNLSSFWPSFNLLLSNRSEERRRYWHWYRLHFKVTEECLEYCSSQIYFHLPLVSNWFSNNKNKKFVLMSNIQHITASKGLFQYIVLK